MDNLTHALLGFAVGAARRPDGGPGTDRPFSDTDKAVLMAAVLGAEIPDLDLFWPVPDAVLKAVQAHRGLSHSLTLAPVLALVVMLMVWPFFRKARLGIVYIFALISIVVAHLIPDLWTGWGVRIWLPFSDARVALDWSMVVDPIFLLPMLIASIWALFRRQRWRQVILTGLVVSVLYMGGRGISQFVLTDRVAAAYPEAQSVQVFPAWMTVTTWRYIAVVEDEYAMGQVRLTRAPIEQKRATVPDLEQEIPEHVRAVPTVREALDWARFPVLRVESTPDGATELRVADLRYHLRGEPTLTFVIKVKADGDVELSELERGGSPRELIQRWLDSL